MAIFLELVEAEEDKDNVLVAQNFKLTTLEEKNLEGDIL